MHILKRIALILTALTLTTMLLPPAQVTQAAQAASPGPALSTSTALGVNSKGAAELLQFTADGHVLGFQPDGVYVVGGDHMLKATFVGAAGVAPVSSQPPSSDGQTRPLSQVTYPHLWEGISLTYQQAADGIAKSSYRLDPGADVDQIRLHYNVPVQVDAGGRLFYGFETGRMSESAPVAWQEMAGQRVPVAASFRLLAEREVGFALGEYDPAYPLIIDPPLQWHTFMGSSGLDLGQGIAVDGSGNVYVTGGSQATWGSPVNPHAGSSDAFIARLDSSGALQWHTFMGSSSADWGYGIAVDGSGHVYVTGYSYATWGSPVNPYAGSYDAFAAQLDGNGALQWHTFMGSSGGDVGYGIAADGSGHVYVTGSSEAAWGSPVNPYAGGYDAFAAQLDSSGVLQWNTFMGSSDYFDEGRGIAVDGSGHAYVTGYSHGAWGSPVNPYAGGYDAFAAQLDSSGALQWHTFMGSSSKDVGFGVAVDGSGNPYVAGYSEATWGSPVNPHSGIDDAFAARLDSSGALQWNTFMGSSSADWGSGITVGSGNVYVTGFSDATWGSPVDPYAGGRDAFAAQLDSSGALQWHTFMGSSSADVGDDITVDGSGNVYATGSSRATWGSPINPHAGIDDVFVAKFGYNLSISKTADPDTDVTYHGEVTYTVVLNNSGATDASGTLFTDTLPGEVDFDHWVEQPGGASVSNDEIIWSGTVTASTAITFTFVVTHSGNYGNVVTNTAEYSHASGDGSDDATFTVESASAGSDVYLPMIMKDY